MKLLQPHRNLCQSRKHSTHCENDTAATVESVTVIVNYGLGGNRRVRTREAPSEIDIDTST